ncbi:hypothetical protein LIER_11415 [Lithospermum erythrorhizon]|uniref:Uncharacterized protein n=1 Tax=Lithospermum erythrorhizon TaxID=34254 RepID=A0AAV3PP77_LITER
MANQYTGTRMVGIIPPFLNNDNLRGVVEHIRREKATKEGFWDKPDGTVGMLPLWLIPQGVPTLEAFDAISQTEFTTQKSKKFCPV